jgi:hypothetical protein
MSPAKKSLKTVALPIAKLGFMSVPRISQGSYRSWLGTLMKHKPNQKLMLKLEKDVIDQRFREQAMQEYALESNTLKRALADVSTALIHVRKAPTDGRCRLTRMTAKPYGPD